MSEIDTFFERAGVAPQGQSGTRKWFVLESLQLMNGTNDLEKALVRIVSPREYSRDYTVIPIRIDDTMFCPTGSVDSRFRGNDGR